MRLPESSFSMKWFYGVVSICCGLAVMAVVFCKTVQKNSFAALNILGPGHLLMLASLVAGGWICHGCRFYNMTRALGHRLPLMDCIMTAVSVEFAVAATPSGSGGVVTRFGFFKSRGVPTFLSLSIFSVNVFIDICLSVLLTVMAIFVVVSDSQWRKILSLGGMLDAGALIKFGYGAASLTTFVLIGMLFSRLRWREGLPLNGRGRHRLLRRIGLGFYKIKKNLLMSYAVTRRMFLKHRWTVILDFVLACVQWCCRYAVLPVLIYIFGGYINPLPFFPLQGFMFLAGLLLVLPGGGGALELLSAFILPAFIPLEYVAVVVILWRTFTYYINLGAGGAVFAFACLKGRDEKTCQAIA